MSDIFCISVTFLDRRFHGRCDGGEPEWPPSPLRLMQAIVAANADQVDTDGKLDRAFAWIEKQYPPLIFTPKHTQETPYCLSVPNNAMDIVGKAWIRKNYFGTGDANPATHRTMKTVRPIRLIGGDTVHYVWKLNELSPPSVDLIHSMVLAAQRLVALGWGIDMVVGQAELISSAQVRTLSGERWDPTVSTNPNALRVPTQGTMDALRERYEGFLGRIGKNGLVPVEPLSRFRIVGYRRSNDPIPRPHAVFELRNPDDGSFCRYSHRRLIHLAGMVRHLAIETLKHDPPHGVDKGWVETYIAGHVKTGGGRHRQLSYLPLPSIGHRHTDPGVRRVMIAAPVGDDAWLAHLARRLAGQTLDPENGDEFSPGDRPVLVPVRRDKVARFYLQPASVWHSFTPVILPGHGDHKPAKTRALIERALIQSGINQPCEFDWSAYAQFPKSFSAHKCGKDKRPQGYIRPGHLRTQTAVHLTLRFRDDVKVPGPIVIGAGRHCGLGLMVGAIDG